VEIHSELTTFNQFDELLINNHPPEASLNQEISGDGQTITINGLTLNAGDTIAVIQPGRTLPSAGQYTVWAQSDADGEGQKWAASPGTGEEQKTVFLTDPIVTPTTPGTLAIYPDPPTAGQSDQDVVYTYTCGQNLSNGTFTITSEFTSFSVYNAVKLGESNWRDLTADEISDDGDRVTIKDIYLSAGEAIQIGQAAQTMPAAGNYSITVSVDADGDALAYLPSSESFSLQVMEGGSFINGKVNYIDEPVANIQVVVQDFETTDFVSQTFTDSDGEFRLEVSPGTYQVVVEPGTDFPYARSWYDGQGGTFVRQELIPVTLSEGQSVTLEPFFLEPGACISGLVTDAAGNGLAGIGVVGEWLQQNGGVGTGAETGPDGSYILTGLRYGQYKVWAPGRWMPNDNYWAQTFYDGKSSWDEADIITVNGASINGIDLVLSPAGVISGYVMTADGDNPIASLHVFAVDYETGYWIAGTDTDDNGLYRLILPVGKYRVRAQSSQNHQPFIDAWYNAAGGTTDYELAEPVTVNTGAGTENINFRLQGGFFISGQVTDQQGKGIENLHVYTENELTDQWTSGTETDDEGYYSLVVPAGEYRIHALPFAGQPYAAVWYNHAGGSIFDNAMEIVDVSANVSGIDFILPPGGWISGRVVDMNGNGLADISLDACLDEWCNGSRSELDGSYTISGLPYGYYLVMCPSGGRWSPADSFWLRSYYDGHSAREDADIIELGPAVYSYDNIDFTLQSGGGISGQVLLGDGETPMAGVHVYAQDYSTGIWGDGTETDENGFFSLIVPAGSYRVKAVPSANGWPYMDEWYNSAGGSGIPEQAQPVEVSLNTVTDDIDFTLEPMNTPVVKVSSANGAVGSIVEISIGSDYVAGAKGAQFKLHYNPAVVEIVQQTGATGSPLFDNEGNPLWEITSGGGQLNLETNVIRDVTQAQTGFAYIAIASQDQLSSTFCTIKFRLIGAYGDFSHIWITPTEDSNGIVLSDGSPEGIPCLTEEGVITIGVLHGDINNNGVVDVGDAILALRYDAGLIELAPSQELAANVNGDLTPEGEQIVNYQDAILILRKVVHLIDFFPITPLPGGGGGTPMIPEN
jgi:hypothetical protein